MAGGGRGAVSGGSGNSWGVLGFHVQLLSRGFTALGQSSTNFRKSSNIISALPQYPRPSAWPLHDVQGQESAVGGGESREE